MSLYGRGMGYIDRPEILIGIVHRPVAFAVVGLVSLMAIVSVASAADNQSLLSDDPASPVSPEYMSPESETKMPLAPPYRWGGDDLYLQFSGQINKAYLSYDDGLERQDYWLVDNANSSTRARLDFYNRSDDWIIRSRLEWQWDPYSTGSVNQSNHGDVNWATNLLRKAEFWFENERYGRFWVGQGSMASDGTAEVDLSGTTLVGYSSVGDLAGGQFFRTAGGALSAVQVYDGFKNLDGLGRLLRVRYDTPSIAGIRLSGSYGTRVVPNAGATPSWDAALTYDLANDQLKFSAAGGYSDSGSGVERWIGSASILVPSGWNFSVAGAHQNTAAGDQHYIYGKIGYLAQWFAMGATATAVDSYIGFDLNSQGSESRSYGFLFVQNFDAAGIEAYLGVRSYDFSETTAVYRDSLGILAGARWTF